MSGDNLATDNNPMATPQSETFSVVARLAGDREALTRLAERLEVSSGGSDIAIATFESANDWTFEAYFETPPNQPALRALVCDVLGEKAAAALAFETIAMRDWVKASLEGLPAVRAGRFIVHGAHARASIPISRIGIEIEAALAFGTGHHGTTRACLFALDRILKSSRPGKILDLGTGTGILAIAAARALRVKVQASDIAPRAVQVARENAKANRAGAFVTAIVARGLSSSRLRRGDYDLIFANILAGPLKILAAPIKTVLAPRGWVVLSGLLPDHANTIVSAYRSQGLTLIQRIALEGWVTLVMRNGTA